MSVVLLACECLHMHTVHLALWTHKFLCASFYATYINCHFPSSDSDSDRRLCLQPQEKGSAKDSSVVVDKFSKHSLPTLTTHTDPGPPLSEEAGAHGERRVVQMQSANSDSVATLREVCPAACTAELLHCLHVSDGDLEGAACLLLYRQETGTAITEKTGSTSRKVQLRPDAGQNLSVLCEESWH